MKLKPGKRLVWDIETDGLLHELTRIHVLSIRDLDTRQLFVFRRNKREDTILDGVEMLNEADLIVGHNIIGFDNEALWKVYGDKFNPKGIVRDTLVMARMLFADEKERDFRRWKRGQLEGKYIGSHELGAWGQRLGFPKDEYSARRKEKATERWNEDRDIFDEIIGEVDDDLLAAVREERKAGEYGDAHARAIPIVEDEDPKNALVRFSDLKAFIHYMTWGFWNQDMEDYGVQDLDPTEALWLKIEKKDWPQTATRLEHKVHALMERVTQNGFPFDVDKARELEADLRAEQQELERKAKDHFGSWWVPAKWKLTNESTTYVSPQTGNEEKDQRPFKPRPEFGEDDSRKRWGEVVVPKRSMKFKKPQKDGNPHADKTAGAAYCPVKLVDFNPGSRPQIINRLTKIYEWEPQEFTEKGNPVVNDEILRELAVEIPICETLAELFYYNKRLGQLVDGTNGWIKKAFEVDEGVIHPRFNVGGTVTNRCTHSNPNIAQVPRVVFKKPVWKENGEPVLGPDGEPIRGRPVRDDAGDFVLDENGKVVTKKVLMKGREGDHGWECRSLFTVKPGFVLMGADQSGIELRCLAHYMATFDNGDYGRLLLEDDIHTVHQNALGLESRDMAKTFIYAMIYGASDYKLGITIDPSLILKPKQAKALGKKTRDNIMTRLPALGALIKATQREAKRGYVTALDGRQLYVRGMHAALNTKLQGAGATIAKAWCVIFEEMMEEEGLVHGWDGDFALMAWVHDEMQTAVRDDERVRLIAEKCINAASKEAGETFDFALPVDIDVKWGMTWAETH